MFKKDDIVVRIGGDYPIGLIHKVISNSDKVTYSKTIVEYSLSILYVFTSNLRLANQQEINAYNLGIRHISKIKDLTIQYEIY